MSEPERERTLNEGALGKSCEDKKYEPQIWAAQVAGVSPLSVPHWLAFSKTAAYGERGIPKALLAVGTNFLPFILHYVSSTTSHTLLPLTQHSGSAQRPLGHQEHCLPVPSSPGADIRQRPPLGSFRRQDKLRISMNFWLSLREKTITTEVLD